MEIDSIKLRLFNSKFFKKHREKLIDIATRNGSLDAFDKAHADIRETMADDLDKKAEELSLRKLAELLSIVDERAIITFDSRARAIFIGGERADDGRLHNLKAEAEFFQESDLWKILYETPKRLAEKAMFTDDGKLENQLLKGRAILYTLETQKKILDTFLGLSTG